MSGIWATDVRVPVKICVATGTLTIIPPPSLSSGSYSLTLPVGVSSGAMMADGTGVLSFRAVGPDPNTLISQTAYISGATASASAGGLVPLNTLENNTLASSAFSAGTSAFTIPTTGVYLVSFQIVFSTAILTFSRVARVLVNGVSRMETAVDISLSLGTARAPLSVARPFALVQGDVVTLQTTASVSVTGLKPGTFLSLHQLT